MNNFIAGNGQPMSYADQMFYNTFSMQPSNVKGLYNETVDYNRRYLWHMLYSVYDFTLPKKSPTQAKWQMNWFRFLTFHVGSFAVIYTREHGWTPQYFGVEKIGIHYQPTEIIVASPFFKSDKRGIVGLNCELVHPMDDWIGLTDLINDYAVKLSQIDKGINIFEMNSNLSYMFETDDKKVADEIKEAYDQAYKGKPLVVLNKNIVNGKSPTLMFPMDNSYTTIQRMEAKQYITSEFLTRIGINNANLRKKERMISDEVNQNNDETMSICGTIMKNLKEGFEEVNKISDLGLSVRYNFEKKQGEVSTYDSKDRPLKQ